MKPILILRVNVGKDHGGVLPLNIFYNNDSYFREATEQFCSQHPALNDPNIKEIIYGQIKSGVTYSLQKEK